LSSDTQNDGPSKSREDLFLLLSLLLLFLMVGSDGDNTGLVVYDWAEKRPVYKLYAELKRHEDEMPLAPTSGTSNDLIERLDRLKQRASHLSVPTPFKPLVYALRLSPLFPAARY